VQGFQTAREAPFPLQASACCKHFVANEYEDGRTSIDSYVPQQDLADSYLPPFQACVEEGQVRCPLPRLRQRKISPCLQEALGVR